jgi:acyl-coenzyme A thioesterase PaaI-like protein
MVVIPKVTLNTDLNEGFCFGCGANNPMGLKLKFTRDAETLRAEFTPDKMHQGWPGLLHGGIVATLLDEVMSNAAYTTGKTCLTAEMQLRQRKPIPVTETLVITAWITRRRSKILDTAGKICLKDGTVVAESTAKQFIAENAAGHDKVKENRSHV